MGEMTAPGAVDLVLGVDRQSCLNLYERAHKSRAEDYTRMALSMESQALKHASGGTHDTGNIYTARAETIRAMKDKSDFNDWLDADVKIFENMDSDNNGFLEKKEFKAFAKETFDLSEDKADEVFKKWDIDKGESVGPYEFCVLMSIWHGEFELKRQQMESEALVEAVADAIPCTCCGGCCIDYSCKFGCTFSLCTLGLSWIPCWCIARAAAKNLADEEGMQKRKEEAMVEAGHKAKKQTREIIMKGPTDGLLSANDCRHST